MTEEQIKDIVDRAVRSAVVEAAITKVRSAAMELQRENEQRFILDVTERGALTVAEAEQVLDDWRDEVQFALEKGLKDFERGLLAMLSERSCASSANDSRVGVLN